MFAMCNLLIDDNAVIFLICYLYIRTTLYFMPHASFGMILGEFEGCVKKNLYLPNIQAIEK